MRRFARGLLVATIAAGLAAAGAGCDDRAAGGGGGPRGGDGPGGAQPGGGGAGGLGGGGGAGGLGGGGGEGGLGGGGGAGEIPCGQLQQPAALQLEEEILEAASLITELDPRRVVPVHVWSALEEASQGLTQESTGCDVFRVSGPQSFEVSAPEQGCGADGRWWWGSISAKKTMTGSFVPTGYVYEVGASSFIQMSPGLLVEFDGHSKLSCTDPYATTDCQVAKYGRYGSGSGLLRIVRSDPAEPTELPTGAWYLSWFRTGNPWDEEPDVTHGYLLHAEGELGPHGDLCFSRPGALGGFNTLELRGARTVQLEWTEENGWAVVDLPAAR